jgi:pilus assembly protein CpaF
VPNCVDVREAEEVWMNDPRGCSWPRNGRHELTNLKLSREQVAELVERMLKSGVRRIDLSQPFDRLSYKHCPVGSP